MANDDEEEDDGMISYVDAIIDYRRDHPDPPAPSPAPGTVEYDAETARMQDRYGLDIENGIGGTVRASSAFHGFSGEGADVHEAVRAAVGEVEKR